MSCSMLISSDNRPRPVARKLGLKSLLLNEMRRVLFQHPLVENRLRTLTHGKPASHWICRLLPNHYQYRRPTIRQTGLLGHGPSLRLDLSDSMEWHLYFGIFDPSQQNLLTLGSAGDTVIDVGANIGATMLALSEKVGSQGRVIGFEPDPCTYEKCNFHLQSNGYENAEIHPLGLGATTSSKRLRVRSEKNQGMNQIVPEDCKSQGTQIEITTIDSFVANRGLERIDLIKIDVEGYESEVLKGARETIGRFCPKLFIEIDDANLKDHNSSPEAVLAFLRPFGYRFYKDTMKLPLTSLEPRCHFDLVAVVGSS